VSECRHKFIAKSPNILDLFSVIHTEHGVGTEFQDCAGLPTILLHNSLLETTGHELERHHLPKSKWQELSGFKKGSTMVPRQEDPSRDSKVTKPTQAGRNVPSKGEASIEGDNNEANGDKEDPSDERDTYRVKIEADVHSQDLQEDRRTTMTNVPSNMPATKRLGATTQSSQGV
jgi:hypothetical protein